MFFNLIQGCLDHTEDTEESTEETEVEEGGVLSSAVAVVSIIVLRAVLRRALLCHNEIKSA